MTEKQTTSKSETIRVQQTPPVEVGSAAAPPHVSRAEHEKQIQQLRRLVATARILSQTIRRVFPVVGEVWPFDGYPIDPGATVEVLNALRHLERILYPPEPAATKRHMMAPETKWPAERVTDSAAWWILDGPVQWQVYLTSILSIMHCYEQILTHYQCGDYIAEGRAGPPPWTWPAIRPIPAGILDSLYKAAEGLECLVSDHQRRVDNVSNLSKCPTNEEVKSAQLEQTSPVLRAITLMYDYHMRDQRLNVKDIPGIVGCSYATLYRDPQFRATRKALKKLRQGQVPRGHKTMDGAVDAGVEDDGPEG